MVSEPAKFPTRRLRDAGATQAEITELQLAFARSDEVYQAEFANAFLGKSKVDVLVWLQDARSEGLVTVEATETPDEIEAASVRSKQKREAEANATIATGNEESEGEA